MTTSRRKFFGWMAASPLAAKAAGDQAVAELMKSDISGGVNRNPVNGILGGSPSLVDGVEVPIEKKLSSCINYVNMFGLPKEVEELYRREAKGVYSIDYDIANKKSWSLAVKVMTQRQRNYQSRVDALEREANRQWGMARLRKILGFEFPTWYQ